MLATTLASADGQWVLQPRADAGAELAIARRGEEGTAETRVIDRSFVEDGVRWIIDYKTADLGPAADAARLAAHAEALPAQLEAYAGCSPAKAGRCAWRCSMSRMASWRVWNTIVPAVEFTGFDRFARCRRIRHLRRLGDEKCPTRNIAW
jgi:hypothetical protein